MKVIEFEFVGYQQYEHIYPALEKLVYENMKAQNYYFMMAINEAVCNAARYSKVGLNKAKVKMEVKIMNCDMAVSVYAETRNFDSKYYQKKLLELLKKPERKLSWGKYTADTESSRGFWYMLTAVDFLVIDYNGNHITLYSRIPFYEEQISTKIEDLVPKFKVQGKNGVIE